MTARDKKSSRGASGARSRRAERHDENDQRILDAALALVGEGGFDGLSMSKLAGSVGFTPGALYRYIGSKDALLGRILESALSEARRFLDAATGALPQGSGPLATICALALGYRAFARERPHSFGLLAISMAEPRVLLREPAAASGVISAMVAALTPLSRALEQAVSKGLLREGSASDRAVCVFALLQGISQLHKQVRHAPDVLDLDRLTAAGVTGLLVGWGAPQAQAEQDYRAADTRSPRFPQHRGAQ